MGKIKVLVFGASSSIHSINKQLAVFAGSLLDKCEVTVIDLNDFEMPIFSVDKEESIGIPEKAHNFKEAVKSHNGLIISMAEHNGAYSAAFKNIFDWVSRMDGTVWENKPILLLATSEGKRGGASVLQIAANRFPFNGGKIINTFSLPSFYTNFEPSKGIIEAEKLQELKNLVADFENQL